MGKVSKQLSRDYRERMIEVRKEARASRARDRRLANKAMGAGVITVRHIDRSA